MKRRNKAFVGNYIGWGLVGAFVLGGLNPAYGAVVQRGAAVTRPPTSRAASAVNRNVPTATETVAEPTPEPALVIENKTEKFEESTTYGTGNVGGDDDVRAAAFQRQLDAVNAAEAKANNAAQDKRRAAAGNACNAALTKCMAEKCGTDYSQCAADGDTDWGMKMDACHRATDACTANEFARLSVEIKADRDLNATLANYQVTLDCGNNYNSCLVRECGDTFKKCWGKKAGDAAIAKCTQQYRDCTRTDNGLNARAVEVFGTLRANAETQVRADEKRLMAMRDDMEQACKNMGALFDQRTLMCVYTVNLFANDAEHPYSSKKLFAGGSFNCTQDWFGIDITTFKENAYRETETQEAVMGGTMAAGFGLAAGMVTSGQISRAIDTKKAENAVKKAKEESSDGGSPKDKNKKCDATCQKVKELTKAANKLDRRYTQATEGVWGSIKRVAGNTWDGTRETAQKVGNAFKNFFKGDNKTKANEIKAEAAKELEEIQKLRGELQTLQGTASDEDKKTIQKLLDKLEKQAQKLRDIEKTLDQAATNSQETENQNANSE